MNRRGCKILLLLSLSWGAAHAQAPQQVLTDTADYCAELELQVDQAMTHAATAPTQEVRTLYDDGETMCRNGEIKGGIVRLRRALVALRRNPAN